MMKMTINDQDETTMTMIQGSKTKHMLIHHTITRLHTLANCREIRSRTRHDIIVQFKNNAPFYRRQDGMAM